MGGSPRSGGPPRPGRSRSSSVRGSGASHGLGWARDAQRLGGTPDLPDQDGQVASLIGQSLILPLRPGRAARLRAAQVRPGHRGHPRAGLRRRAGPAPADPPGLERHQGGVPEPHIAAPRSGPGDLRGVRGVDHVGALGRVGHPQRDPQVGVGPDVRGDHAGGPLGGQDQVQAQRAAALRDADQPGHEVRQVPGQRRELVDHDHQPGQGR